MKLEEQALLDAVFAHEPGADEALIERYRGLLYSVFHAPGFGFPSDYVDDLFQSFVLSLIKDDYAKLRAFEGRNQCSLATFLQTVATRFVLDERRKWQRAPRALGESGDDEEGTRVFEDEEGAGPDAALIDSERLDTFHNLLFSLDWKRTSAILWVFRGITRERIAEVMSTSRANIDALFKRGKDQMIERVGQGQAPTRARETDAEVLSPVVQDLLAQLFAVPLPALHDALLRRGSGRRALLGLVLVEYPRFRCSRAEIARIANTDDIGPVCEAVLGELVTRLLRGAPA